MDNKESDMLEVFLDSFYSLLLILQNPSEYFN